MPRLIGEAGRVPVKRHSLRHPVELEEALFTVLV
jgi:hypothetical protein